MDYDKIEHQFYLNKKDVLNHSSLSEEELVATFGEDEMIEKKLRDISRSVYRFMYSHYKGVQSMTHKRKIEYMLFKGKNKEGMQLGLKMAMIEWVKGVVSSNMDLNAYNSEGKPYIPPTVEQELRMYGLIIRGEIQYINPKYLEGDF